MASHQSIYHYFLTCITLDLVMTSPFLNIGSTLLLPDLLTPHTIDLNGAERDLPELITKNSLRTSPRYYQRLK